MVAILEIQEANFNKSLSISRGNNLIFPNP